MFTEISSKGSTKSKCTTLVHPNVRRRQESSRIQSASFTFKTGLEVRQALLVVVDVVMADFFARLSGILQIVLLDERVGVRERIRGVASQGANGHRRRSLEQQESTGQLVDGSVHSFGHKKARRAQMKL